KMYFEEIKIWIRSVFRTGDVALIN
ncbi:TetR family transcriptional regulator, partial [Bacillus vallismortis]|nr:TetR family transcriptional regulator [Bacillus vallismortis]